ncbi:MAG TPA: hypothetical protein VF482_04340 [Trebonia sp.]
MPALWLAVLAGVVLGDVEAEFFEFGDEFAEPFVVVEPGAVVGGLLIGQDAGGGLAVFLAGPLVVGAVRLRGSAWQRQPGYPQRVIRSATVPGRAKAVPARRAVISAAMALARACWAGVGDTLPLSQPDCTVLSIS